MAGELSHDEQHPHHDGHDLSRARTIYTGRLQTTPSTVEECETRNLAAKEEAWRQVLGTAEFYRAHLWRDVLVELFGTLALTVASIGAVLSSFGRQPGPNTPPRIDPPTIGIGVSHFFLLGFAIIATRGGHMNPLITVFTVFLGLTRPLRGAAYIAAQTVGASMAAVLMRKALPMATQRWSLNELGQGELGGCAAGSQISPSQLFMIEFGCSLFLLLVAHGVAFDQREALMAGPIVGPLIISATLGALIFASGTLVQAGFSGAIMNPARCFGPMLAAGGSNWDNWWVYWMAPTVAAGVSAAVFTLIHTPELTDYAEPSLPSSCSHESLSE